MDGLMETIGGASDKTVAVDLIRRLGVVRQLNGRAESELSKVERMVRRRYGSDGLLPESLPLPARLAAVERLLLERVQGRTPTA